MNYDQVVVGGGCSGVLAVRELLRRTDHAVTLIEPGEPGGGVAYGLARPWHVLNSRAGVMSADPDDPGHFARWAGADPEAFLPRALYGRYLREVLDRAMKAHPGRLRLVTARATGIGDGVVRLDDDTAVAADHVVLATGNPAGAHPPSVPFEVRAHPAYVEDPWNHSLEAENRPVLLIGTGLTAIDVALTLAAGRTTAPIVMVSRRGLLPLAHTAAAAPPKPLVVDDCARLRDVIRAVREAAGEAGDWRAVVDGLRPHLDRVWGALTPAEQERFLRHLARPWECHRHRMAPAVADRVAAMRASGELLVRAGGVRGIAPGPDGGLTVTLSSGPMWFGAVVNCSGPGRLPGAADPLTRSLLAAGAARVGPHGLGLDVDADGRLRSADGIPDPRTWVLGPLRRGAQWETTAVPEIRSQAQKTASRISNKTDIMA